MNSYVNIGRFVVKNSNKIVQLKNLFNNATRSMSTIKVINILILFSIINSKPLKKNFWYS
jgi:hypothetical protein